jgi:hypothetical protein
MMAHRQFYASRPFRYGNRMLTAGDPVSLSGPDARLFTKMGMVVERKPRPVRAAPATRAVEPPPPIKTEIEPEKVAEPAPISVAEEAPTPPVASEPEPVVATPAPVAPEPAPRAKPAVKKTNRRASKK